jgi:hypothetical protein
MRHNDVSAAPRVVQSRRESDDDDEAIAAVDGFRPQIPDAWYEARYIGHETGVVFMAPKCFLHFEIVEHGEHLGTRLFRAFRVRKLAGRSGKGGKFVVHAGGDLFALLAKLLDVRLRTDRITLRPLRAMLFRVKTRTVTTNHAQQERPEQSRYSVIAEIERQQ